MPTITDSARTKSFAKSSDKGMHGSGDLPLLNPDRRSAPSAESLEVDGESTPHWRTSHRCGVGAVPQITATAQLVITEKIADNHPAKVSQECGAWSDRVLLAASELEPNAFELVLEAREGKH